jgi:hypothetical protein
MKALNRQQRKAAIWKFVILYLITVILIVTPFVFLGAFSNSQKESINAAKRERSQCEETEKTLEARTKERNSLQAALNKCNEEKLDLQKKIELDGQGVDTRSSEPSSSGTSNSQFGDLNNRYTVLTSKMGDPIRIAHTITKNNFDKLNKTNYEKLQNSVKEIVSLHTELGNLNKELKELAK